MRRQTEKAMTSYRPSERTLRRFWRLAALQLLADGDMADAAEAARNSTRRHPPRRQRLIHIQRTATTALCGARVLGRPASPSAPRCVVCDTLANNQRWQAR